MRKILVLLMLLGARGVLAQGSFYQFRAPIPNTTVRTCPVPSGGSPCPSPVSIFQDSALTISQSNPYTTGPNGNSGFWVAAGDYTVQLSGVIHDSFIITLGGGTGGDSHNGNNGDVQVKKGTSFSDSSINDYGKRVNITEDMHFKGPNPHVDVTTYGVRAFSATTTGSINSGTTALSIAAASGFVNGDGIVVRGAGARFTLSTPAAPTVVQGSNGSIASPN